MTKVERAIILAAGRGHQLDGVNKVLIRHPKNGKSILDHAIDAFEGKRITVVVGFRAIQIMEQYPNLDYVINYDWAITNNAMSLGLAINSQPTYVVSGDIFFEKSLIQYLDQSEDNLALTALRENRALSAIHCVCDQRNVILETYQGPVRDVAHPEAIGMFKICDPGLLKDWKKNCMKYGNLFVGQTLPCHGAPIQSVPLADEVYEEINTPSDYLRFVERVRK
jgi:choline kinase